MDQDETKNDSPHEPESGNEIEKLTENLNKVSAELSAIKTSVEKRKSETTTLKILFYTALAVLMFGFIYSNQTLQRAQHNNLETNITALQSQINHNLLALERKLHEKIIALENGTDENLEYRLQNSIKNMNRALGELPSESQTMARLIREIKKDSKELSNMVREVQNKTILTPEPVP